MRKHVVVTSLLGIVLMLVGATTTFIALGQNPEVTPEVEEANVQSTATFTPLPQPTEVPASESNDSAGNVDTDSNPPPVNIAPTIAQQNQVLPSATPTLIPTEVVASPTAIILPTLTQAAPTVEPSAEVTVTGDLPPDNALFTPDGETQQLTPTLPVEQTLTVQSTLPPSATMDVQVPQVSTVTPQPELSSPSADPDLTLTAWPALEQTPVEGENNPPEITVASPTALPTEIPVVTTATPDPLAGQLTAQTQTVTPEVTPTATVLPELTAEVTSPVEYSASHIAGQVSGTVEVSINLLLPNGEVLNQPVDEQGVFRFEVSEAGDYRIEAVAAGYLSREMSFTLAAGESLELPPAIMDSRDPNQDNRIDIDDIVLVAANFDGPALVSEADLNDDDWVDIRDLTLVSARFGITGPLPWQTS